MWKVLKYPSFLTEPKKSTTCPRFRIHEDLGIAKCLVPIHTCQKCFARRFWLPLPTCLPTYILTYPVWHNQKSSTCLHKPPASGSAGGIHTCTNSACDILLLVRNSVMFNSMLFLKSSVTHIISSSFLLRPIMYSSMLFPPSPMGFCSLCILHGGWIFHWANAPQTVESLREVFRDQPARRIVLVFVFWFIDRIITNICIYNCIYRYVYIYISIHPYTLIYSHIRL